jgi:ketosteroid isomerase-like protein
MSHESAELLLRGYHAFVEGDLEAIETMLDPDVEWVAAGESEAILVSRDRVLEVLADRVEEDYHVVVDRAIGLGDRAVVSIRPTSDRCRADARTSSAAGPPSSTCVTAAWSGSRSTRTSRRLSGRRGSKQSRYNPNTYYSLECEKP